MAMDSTLQVRMDSGLKADVEELYRSLGTSFAEAVRIFAQQSLLAGGMPFRPTLRAWEDMTDEEINAKLLRGQADIEAGRFLTQDDLDRRMKGRFARGRNTAV